MKTILANEQEYSAEYSKQSSSRLNNAIVEYHSKNMTVHFLMFHRNVTQYRSVAEGGGRGGKTLSHQLKALLFEKR